MTLVYKKIVTYGTKFLVPFTGGWSGLCCVVPVRKYSDAFKAFMQHHITNADVPM